MKPQHTVTLLHASPLHLASNGARTCWDSHDKSDTVMVPVRESDVFLYPSGMLEMKVVCGTKDAELIDRVGNKFRHASILEHLNYTFYIDGISRACLQELSRHRHTSPSVKSTRYTLKELMNEEPVMAPIEDRMSLGMVRRIATKYLVFTDVFEVDLASTRALYELQLILKKGVSNDKAKYCLPESYKVTEQLTINLRSLQNFLALRLDKSALWEIQELACTIVHALPKEHLFLVEDIVRKAVDGNQKIAELIKVFD